MANIPFLSFDSPDSFPASKGSSPFSSNMSEDSAFSSFLQDAGNAFEEFSFDSERSTAAPVSSKIDDEPDVSEPISSNPTQASEDVEEISGGGSSDSDGLKDGNESESSTESEEVPEETVAGEQKKEGVQTPEKDDPAMLVGPVAMIFVDNLDTASAPVGEKKAEGEGAKTVAAVAKPVSLKAPSEGQALQATSAQTESDAESPANGTRATLQGVAATESEAAKLKSTPQNTAMIQAAGVEANPNKANISIGGQQAGGGEQAAKTPQITGAGAVLVPEEIEIASATVTQAVDVPEEAVVQVIPDEAPTPDEAAPATAVKTNKNQSATDGKEGVAPAADVELDEGVDVSKVAGANSEAEAKSETEEEVSQAAAKAAGKSAVAPEAAALRSADATEAVAGKDRVVADIDGVAETQAAQPAAGARAEAALKLRLQQQVLEAASSRLHMAIREGVASARIRLDPPSLGRMDMRLQVEAGVLNAKVTVEHVWVKEAVTSNLRDLRDSLAEQGVEIESFSVDVDSGMGSGDSNNESEGGAFGDELLFGDMAEDDPEIDAVHADASAVATAAGRASVDFFA